MINTNLPVPLHIQVSNLLEQKIKDGVYKEKIPSERELIEHFMVSRTTIREAVSNLVNEGILKKIHGKGTFINNKPPIQEWLYGLNSFTETVRNMGMEPGSKLLHSGKVNYGDHSIDVFNHSIYTIKRLRYANGEPVAIEKHFYPLNIGLQLEAFDLNKETIYSLLEDELGYTLFEADQLISTEAVDKEVSHLLKVPTHTNVLCVERTIFDPVGNPIEFYVGQYRPDMYAFRVRVQRNAKGNISFARKM